MENLGGLLENVPSGLGEERLGSWDRLSAIPEKMGSDTIIDFVRP